MTEPYYSDAAIAKQAEYARKKAAGERVLLADFVGIHEPRVHPGPDDLCVCCGLDARDSEGGEAHGGQRFCFICLGRGHQLTGGAA